MIHQWIVKFIWLYDVLAPTWCQKNSWIYFWHWPTTHLFVMSVNILFAFSDIIPYSIPVWMARGHVPLHGHRHSGEQGGVLWHQGAGVQVGHQVGEDPDRWIYLRQDWLFIILLTICSTGLGTFLSMRTGGKRDKWRSCPRLWVILSIVCRPLSALVYTLAVLLNSVDCL